MLKQLPPLTETFNDAAHYYACMQELIEEEIRAQLVQGIKKPYGDCITFNTGKIHAPDMRAGMVMIEMTITSNGYSKDLLKPGSVFLLHEPSNGMNKIANLKKNECSLTVSVGPDTKTCFCVVSLGSASMKTIADNLLKSNNKQPLYPVWIHVDSWLAKKLLKHHSSGGLVLKAHCLNTTLVTYQRMDANCQQCHTPVFMDRILTNTGSLYDGDVLKSIYWSDYDSDGYNPYDEENNPLQAVSGVSLEMLQCYPDILPNILVAKNSPNQIRIKGLNESQLEAFQTIISPWICRIPPPPTIHQEVERNKKLSRGRRAVNFVADVSDESDLRMDYYDTANTGASKMRTIIGNDGMSLNIQITVQDAAGKYIFYDNNSNDPRPSGGVHLIQGPPGEDVM